MPKSLFFLGGCCLEGMEMAGRRMAPNGWPLRSTVVRSSGSALRALSGIAWLLPDGGPFNVPGADCTAAFAFERALEVPGGGEPVAEVVVGTGKGDGEMAEPPPSSGGATILDNDERCRYGVRCDVLGVR